MKQAKDFQIKPLNNNKNNITVVFSFNNDYCKYFAVALKSLIENSNQNKFYDIIVFSTDISERNKKLINQMLPTNFSLRIYDVTECINNLLEDIQLSGFKYWSVEMYYRIVIPLIMRSYDRVLYLDSDIVCKKDISELFATDFDNKKLVAIKDAFNLISTLEICNETKKYILETLKVKDIKSYFNSGVILFNIQKICPEEYLIHLKEAFKIELTNCPDQDVLNSIFTDQVKFVDQKWNLQYHMPFLYERFLKDLNKDDMAEYNLTFNNSSIVHYTSPVKPWLNPKVELAEDFWYWARQTVFYEEILYEMYRNELANARFANHLYTKLQSDKKVVLWGASLYLEDFIKRYEIDTDNILGIIDLNKSRQGQFIGKYEILSPDALKSLEIDELILTIINRQSRRYDDVKKYLKENNLEHINLVKL